jgi:hypothetical protein
MNTETITLITPPNRYRRSAVSLGSASLNFHPSVIYHPTYGAKILISPRTKSKNAIKAKETLIY